MKTSNPTPGAIYYILIQSMHVFVNPYCYFQHKTLGFLQCLQRKSIARQMRKRFFVYSPRWRHNSIRLQCESYDIIVSESVCFTRWLTRRHVCFVRAKPQSCKFGFTSHIGDVWVTSRRSNVKYPTSLAVANVMS